MRNGLSGRALVAAIALVPAAFSMTLAAQSGFDKFKIEEGTTYPMEIVAGPDQALWFAEKYGSALGRITLDGQIVHYGTPRPVTGPVGVAVGPGGTTIWMTQSLENVVSKFNRATGKFTDYSVPTLDSQPTVIAAGPDGAMWFVELYGHKIGRITTDGVITEYPLPGHEAFPKAIVAGPDGAMWYCTGGTNRIGRITMAGEITEYDVPTDNAGPYRLTAGPDGAIWFTELLAGKIGRITMGGTITEFDLPARDSGPRGITVGPDSAIWFTMGKGKQKLGRITPSGQVTEYAIPTLADELRPVTYYLLPTITGYPQGIVTGPDGNLWFTDNGVSKIVRFRIAEP